VPEQYFIIGVKIDFADIKSQVGRLKQELLQGLKRRNYHPVKGKSHYGDEEEDTYDPEDTDNGFLQTLSAHPFALLSEWDS
jgi:hypothetical protein